MSVVRIEALRAFCALVELRVPELAGRTCAGTPPSSHVEQLPSLAIEPTQWAYDPYMAEEVAELPGNRLVYNVGWHEAACVVSIVAATPGERSALEDRVIDLFLSTAHPSSGFHMPGVVVIEVTACPQLSQFFCSFDLDTDEWVNTLALDRRYESRIQCTAMIPALIVDGPVYSITQLLLGVQQLPPASSVPVPPTELVQINLDGTLQRIA